MRTEEERKQAKKEALMIHLYIRPEEELRLEFDPEEVEHFSPCRLLYAKDGAEQVLYEDYLYIFICDMLGRIKDIPALCDPCALGEVGKWMEYYSFDSFYNEKHNKEIAMMEKAVLISMENYEAFLYQYCGEIWLELDRGMGNAEERSPLAYYSDPKHYRVSLNAISVETLNEWREQLETVEKMMLRE